VENLLMNDVTNGYLMGHSPRERQRLAMQAAVQNPATEQLLRRAGITTGMRVLDLGCGVGDVSLLAARLVGRHGSVTGIDIDEGALEMARAQAREQGLHQVTFERCAIEELEADQHYDAVVGRHILIHAPYPLAVLERAAQLLRAGGVAAFYEYDFSFLELAYPPSPMLEEMGRVFLSLAPSPNMGARLYHYLLKAGFSQPQCRFEAEIDGGAGAPLYEIFAQAVVSALPRAQAAGHTFSLPRDVTELARRLESEIVANRGSCPMPLSVAGYARWMPAG
jgi:ubiquinone/menaquinone biosynthesis C-methylase UbiE